ARGTQPEQFALQVARIAAGDLRMALLVALDVGGKRVPDETQVLLGAAPIAPARQDQMGAQRYLGVSNGASVAAFDIGHFAAELELGCSRMAMAGRIGQRAALLQLEIEFLGRLAADAEIAVGLADQGSCFCRTGKHAESEQPADDATEPGNQ